MSKKIKTPPSEKSNLHSRNKHRSRYDFEELIKSCPELKEFVSVNKYGSETIDFSNADAVKTLNKALLKYFYGITYWDIPVNYLCPPIPGRADYIHYMADLLASCNNNKIPVGRSVKVLDIGVGASCVYPIIGHAEYGWYFVGSDIDQEALASAKKIIESNPSLKVSVECRLQPHSLAIYRNMLNLNEKFDLSICNPPFHASYAEAMAGTERKWKNLGIKKTYKNILNFGGRNNELWCDGGEEAFIQKMIEQSADMPDTCFWYSTVVSKSSSLPSIYYLLEKVNAFDVKTIEMSQGQKISRIVAWTFLNGVQQNEWRIKHWEGLK